MLNIFIFVLKLVNYTIQNKLRTNFENALTF